VGALLSTFIGLAMYRPAVMIIAVGVLLLSVPQAGADYPVPRLVIKLTPVIANVTASATGNVTVYFNGTIKVDNYLVVEGVLIGFDAKTTNGWLVSINPGIIITTDSNEHTFRASVAVPPNASGVALLTMNGNAQYEGYNLTASVTVAISVAPAVQNVPVAEEPVVDVTSVGDMTVNLIVALAAAAACIDAGLWLVGRRKSG
jgi:hypothetical protein